MKTKPSVSPQTTYNPNRNLKTLAANDIQAYRREKHPVKTKRIRKKKKKETFSVYIYKVLKEIAGSKKKGINKKAMKIMNSLVIDIFDQMTQQSAQLMRYSVKRTLGVKEIEASVKLLLPNDLAQHALSEGRKAVDMFNNDSK